VGPPTKIVQTADEVIFLYAQGGAGTQPTDFRVIPTDGRKHDPVRAKDVTYYGHSVGRWEGDTLVVDSVGFNDITWLDKGGYFHSDKMRVLERFRREGNVLHYQVTVEHESERLHSRRIALPGLRLDKHGYQSTPLIVLRGL
jgi:hypothetical protein